MELKYLNNFIKGGQYMLRKIIQLRYPDGNLSFESDNFTSDWSDNLLIGYGNVVSLGIYGLPGLIFKINQLNANNPETLILNGSGIFNMQMENRPLTDLRIHKDSVNLLTSNHSHYLVLDLIYEGGTE
jgi:hypothetical protein